VTPCWGAGSAVQLECTDASRTFGSTVTMNDDAWLVRSRMIGALPLDDGRVIAAHVLGRSRVVADTTVVSLLDWFSVPRCPRMLRQLPGAPHELLDQTIGQLRGAGLLRRAGNGEVERIRAFYRARLREAPRPVYDTRASRPVRPRGLFPDGGDPPDDMVLAPDVATTLVRSSALAVLPLDDHEMLVTHPLYWPVHMTRELWLLTDGFARPVSVEEALPGFRQAGLTDDDVLQLCAQLRRWGLLWSSTAAEIQHARHLIGPPDRASLRVDFATVNRCRL